MGLEVPEVLKRFTKEAKAYVREHPLAVNKRDDYSIEMADALALAAMNAEAIGKRKLSPKS